MEKKEGKEEEKTTSSSFSLVFGKERLTKAQKKIKKYRKNLKLIKNKNIRTNVIYLYELTKLNNKELKEKYALDKSILGQRKLKIFTEFYNKIREIINSKDLNFINQFIFENDKQSYNIDDEEDKISKINNNNINNNGKIKSKINNNQNNDNNINKVVKNKNKIIPIKNFWKIALINCQFFYISKRDAEILNYLKDIIFIPLDYPNYRIEFHFKDNEYIEDNLLYKEYYYSNYKRERLSKSLGCDIEWEDEEKNPTLKISKKKKEEIKNSKKKLKNKKSIKENIYVNCNSFFNMFDIDKCTIEKDLVESRFFVDDFLPNILEYYLNIIEIKYENEEDELLSNN